MTDNPRPIVPTTSARSNIVMMVISAAIFAYFGWFAQIAWNTPGVTGQVVLFRVMLGWTIRIAAIAFGASALIALVAPVIGNVIFAIVGLLSAILFVVIAIMDLLDPQHGIFAYAPIILILFALWNGYGSWTSLTEVIADRRRAATFAGDRSPYDDL